MSCESRNTNKPLAITAGEVAGLIKSRDEVLGGFLDTLDDFASTLAFEFNRAVLVGAGAERLFSRSRANGASIEPRSLDAAGLSVHADQWLVSAPGLQHDQPS